MSKFFSHLQFGRPQLLAGLLLLAFLGQAMWLVELEISGSPAPGASEQVRIASGWRQLHGGALAGAPYPDLAGWLPIEVSRDEAGFDTEHSPLLSLVTAAPLLAVPKVLQSPEASSPGWRWLPRIPFLVFGVLLGASLWYVARRLCGNSGGFLALTLYCFSPLMLQASAAWHAEPEILAAWGSFGAVFTAMAVAHTLYAPREVVLWNWRRILLLGISLTIAVGSQFSLIVVVPVALAFLLYLAPIRRQAALVIWIAACILATFLLFAIYFFRAHAFMEAMRHASFWGMTWSSFSVPGAYRQVMLQILRACPAFIILLPAALVTYTAWRRTRYFGNTAPLLVTLLFLGLGMAHPHVAGAGFLLAAIPFLLIFVSGVLADLMETSVRPLVMASVWSLVTASALWSLLKLLGLPPGVAVPLDSECRRHLESNELVCNLRNRRRCEAGF